MAGKNDSNQETVNESARLVQSWRCWLPPSCFCMAATGQPEKEGHFLGGREGCWLMLTTATEHTGNPPWMPQVSVFYSSYKSLQVCLFVCFLRRWVGTRTLQPCPQSEKGTWRTKKIPSRSKLQSAPESGVISAWETNKGGENKAGAGLKRPSGQS